MFIEIATDALKGRVFESSLGDLHDSDDSFRKFSLIIEETQGKVCLTNFHSMDLTTDKLRSMIKKRQVSTQVLSKNKNSTRVNNFEFLIKL